MATVICLSSCTPPTTASSKYAGPRNLHPRPSRAPRSIDPVKSGIQARMAPPDCRVDHLWENFAQGIPIPCDSKPPHSGQISSTWTPRKFELERGCKLARIREKLSGRFELNPGIYIESTSRYSPIEFRSLFNNK